MRAERTGVTLLPRSLQARLLLLVLGTVIAVWVGTALMTWTDVRHELDELLDGHLAQAAALLVVQQVREIEGGEGERHEREQDRKHRSQDQREKEREGKRESRAESKREREHDEREHGIDAPSLHRYAPQVAFQVFHEGQLTLRSANAPRQAMLAPGAAFVPGFMSVQIDGTAWRMFAAQGAKHDVQVLVGEQLESRAAILWAVLRGTLWPLALALPLLALAAWWAVRRGVAPLQRLRGTLAARDPRATGPIAMHDVPSEMAPMLDALNQLFKRIAEMVEQERRFTADAAHELRTPLAAIRAQAQVALGTADDAARRNALIRTLQGCDRTAHLVDQLLLLSRLDAQAPPEFELLDLRELVRGVAGEIAPEAIRKDQTLELDAPQPCPVRGNRTLLAVLVRNLIDNAVRYSPAGAKVAVIVLARDGQVDLNVQDSGPGLDAAQLQRLGERFFRLPGSAEGGSGLGWSIVRRIAEVHGAQLQVQRSAALGGLEVRLNCHAPS